LAAAAADGFSSSAAAASSPASFADVTSLELGRAFGSGGFEAGSAPVSGLEPLFAPALAPVLSAAAVAALSPSGRPSLAFAAAGGLAGGLFSVVIAGPWASLLASVVVGAFCAGWADSLGAVACCAAGGFGRECAIAVVST
jgi:hypothetical protein